MRYKDEIMCAAARVVQGVRKKVKEKNPDNNSKGLFNTFHIRRGDFQYKKTRLSIEDIINNSEAQLEDGAAIFVATDERDKSFFNKLKEKYDVYFLDDFMDVLDGINPNYFGMIDQLVSSKGETFFGTWWSTFTGYSNRIRGYFYEKYKIEKKIKFGPVSTVSYKQGTMDSWYFTPADRVEEMLEYRSIRLPLYMREFPTSWRDIDHDTIAEDTK